MSKSLAPLCISVPAMNSSGSHPITAAAGIFLPIFLYFFMMRSPRLPGRICTPQVLPSSICMR